MITLACKAITKSFGIETVIEDVSFHLNEKEKAALVGVNGAGKSTLFKIITQEIPFDSGEIIKAKNLSLGYLSQDTITHSKKSIYEEILSIYESLLSLEEKIRSLELQISTEKNEAFLSSLMEEYAHLSEKFASENGYIYKSLIKGTLMGLGFKENEFDRPISSLSGGQKTRVALAKLLLQNHDILLLDEPTNHLDIDSVEWLEGFLKEYPKTVFIISHDRYFLDRFVTKIIEIENKKSNTYNGNYSFYAKHKELNREIEMKKYIEQQKEVSKQQDLIQRYGSCGSEKRIKLAQSRMKQLEKMDLIEKPEDSPKPIRFSIDPKIESGKEVLQIQNIEKNFDGRKLFKDVSFSVQKKDKIALIGPNGIGKSTLLKIILKNMPSDAGSISYGTNVNIGYYDQEQSNLDFSQSIIDEIWCEYPNLKQQEIRNLLALFLFTGEDVFKKIDSLSGGEKGRVALAKLMLSKSNFLLLDEPTNHLDLSSKEVLENVIQNYNGTVLFVSHDRYFINKVATKVIELTPKGAYCYLGNYDYYLEKKKELLKDELKNEETIKKETSSAKEEWLRRKEEAAKERKRQQEIEKIEKEIENLETKLQEIESLMCIEENYSDPQKAQQLHQKNTEIKENLEHFYALWDEFSSSE